MAVIVFLHAHPDDESSQTAGTMARAAAEGHRVVEVFATNGDFGTPLEAADDALPWRGTEVPSLLVQGMTVAGG